MVGAQNHAEHDLHRLEHWGFSAYTVYLLREVGYECKTSQNLKLAEAISNPRVVDKEMKEWRAKRRDTFGIDVIPSVNQTMQQRYWDVFPMEEKAPMPSRYESKARASETQALTNPRRGEQAETEQGVFPRVERSP